MQERNSVVNRLSVTTPVSLFGYVRRLTLDLSADRQAKRASLPLPNNVSYFALFSIISCATLRGTSA